MGGKVESNQSGTKILCLRQGLVQPLNNGRIKYFLPTIKRTDLVKSSNSTVYDYSDIKNAIKDFTEAKDPR
jgi:hypothetical protein